MFDSKSLKNVLILVHFLQALDGHDLVVFLTKKLFYPCKSCKSKFIPCIFHNNFSKHLKDYSKKVWLIFWFFHFLENRKKVVFDPKLLGFECSPFATWQMNSQRTFSTVY